MTTTKKQAYEFTHHLVVTHRVKGAFTDSEFMSTLLGFERNLKRAAQQIFPEGRFKMESHHQLAPGSAQRDMLRDVLMGYFGDSQDVERTMETVNEADIKAFAILIENGEGYGHSVEFAATEALALAAAEDAETYADYPCRVALLADLDSGESRRLTRTLRAADRSTP